MITYPAFRSWLLWQAKTVHTTAAQQYLRAVEMLDANDADLTVIDDWAAAWSAVAPCDARDAAVEIKRASDRVLQ